jgi:hypothetical protein
MSKQLSRPVRSSIDPLTRRDFRGHSATMRDICDGWSQLFVLPVHRTYSTQLRNPPCVGKKEIDVDTAELLQASLARDHEREPRLASQSLLARSKRARPTKSHQFAKQ